MRNEPCVLFCLSRKCMEMKYSKDVVAGSSQREKKKVFILNRKCVLWAILEGLDVKIKERVKKRSAKVSLGTG